MRVYYCASKHSALIRENLHIPGFSRAYYMVCRTGKQHCFKVGGFWIAVNP